jgi:chemotaxis protein CheX
MNPTEELLEGWTVALDDAVAEVFESMLQRSCAPTQRASSARADICATITFSGHLESLCVVQFDTPSAQQLTSAFLGSSEPKHEQAILADSVGELCNMVAGGWKKRLGCPPWCADLSVPAIALHPESGPPQVYTAAIRRVYLFDDADFVVSLTTPREPDHSV